MLTTRRDARVLQEVRVIREDAIAESSSPKAKATKARRALVSIPFQWKIVQCDMHTYSDIKECPCCSDPFSSIVNDNHCVTG